MAVTKDTKAKTHSSSQSQIEKRTHYALRCHSAKRCSWILDVRTAIFVLRYYALFGGSSVSLGRHSSSGASLSMTSAPFTGSGEKNSLPDASVHRIDGACYVLLHVWYQFTVNANLLFEVKMITGLCIANRGTKQSEKTRSIYLPVRLA